MQKIIMILLSVFLVNVAFAAGGEPCKKQALDMASALDLAYVSSSGVIQGDEAGEPSYEVQVFKDKNDVQDADTVKYTVSFPHNNEDGEGWENTFHITLDKSFCNILNFKFQR